MSAQIGCMRPLINYSSQVQEAPEVFRAILNKEPASWSPMSNLPKAFGFYSEEKPTTDEMSQRAKVSLVASAILTTIFIVSNLAILFARISRFDVIGGVVKNTILNICKITAVTSYILSCLTNSILKSEQDQVYTRGGPCVGVDTLLCDLWNGKTSTWNNSNTPISLAGKIAICVESFFDKLSFISYVSFLSRSTIVPLLPRVMVPIVVNLGAIVPIALNLWVLGFFLKMFACLKDGA